MKLTRIHLGLAAKMADLKWRRRLFRCMSQNEIAMQLHALRKKRGHQTQAAFAKHAGMQQSAISRIEHAEYQG